MYYFESGSVNEMLPETKQLLYWIRSIMFLVYNPTAGGDQLLID